MRSGEAGRLREIERAAGHAFAEIGMPEIAVDEPPPAAVLDAYRERGLAWVAADGADRPIAYLVADVVDGALHVEQVSVDPAHARRGVGRALIEHAAREARARGLVALTLTTFVDVPWNAPYYARCGFRVVPPDAWTPGLAAIRAQEAAHGLDRWPRACMRRELTPEAPPGAQDPRTDA